MNVAEYEALGAGGIGDIASDARGSGARFNSGKPDLALVPLRLVATAAGFTGEFAAASTALDRLGAYQETQEQRYLYSALDALGFDGWQECARVFEYGKRKYAAWNWAKGMPWTVPLACAARHLLAMIEGEAEDPESGLPHRGHVFCNVVMLLTYRSNFAEGNDLPPAGMLTGGVAT